MKTAVGVYPSCIYAQPVVCPLLSWRGCAVCYSNIYPIGVGIRCFFFLVPKGFSYDLNKQGERLKATDSSPFLFSSYNNLYNLKYNSCSCFVESQECRF